MVWAASQLRRDGRAIAADLVRELADFTRRTHLRRIAFDRNLHAAIALAHLAITVAWTVALGETIGPAAGTVLCLSAAAVALMLMLRASEVPAPLKRPAQTEPNASPALDRGTGSMIAASALAVAGARREVSGLLALMSHELRTPLNAILGNAEAIRHEILGPVGAPRYRDSAIHILEGGQNLLRATEDMLTLTGAVAAAAFAPHQPLNIESAVRDILRHAAPEARTKDVALSWQPRTDRAVLSEESALRHAITRIIDGALANANPGAEIHVELTPCADAVELMVTLSHGHDNGGASTTSQVDCATDRGPAALQIAVASTLIALLGTHLHTAYGIDGRWRAIVDLPAAPPP